MTNNKNNKGKDNTAMYEVSAISLTSDYEKLEEYFNKAEAAEILLGESEV